MRRISKFAFAILLLFVFSNCLFAEDEDPPPPLFVGEFFGVKISAENYIFIRNTIAVFGNKWGPQPKGAEDLDDIVWDQLLMSFEAFRRGIVVNQEEINIEVDKILTAEKVEFDRKKDREAYAEWVKAKTNLQAEIFEGQIKHLIQISKLRNVIMESVDPPVSKKEAFDEFLNEHNNLGVELVQFDEKKKADVFYKKAKRDGNFWDKEKEKRPNDFKRPGNVSLEFLIDIWRFPKEACYRMLKMKKGAIYPPESTYKGFGVFKILATRKADRSEYPKFKESYYNQIKDKKRHQGLNQWFDDLKKQARIKKYDINLKSSS